MSKVRIAELEYIHKRRLNSVEDMKEWSKQLDLYWSKWNVIRDQLRDATKDIPVKWGSCRVETAKLNTRYFAEFRLVKDEIIPESLLGMLSVPIVYWVRFCLAPDEQIFRFILSVEYIANIGLPDEIQNEGRIGIKEYSAVCKNYQEALDIYKKIASADTFQQALKMLSTE